MFGKLMAPFGGIAGALLSRRDAASESRSTSKNRKKNIEPNENMTDTNKKRIHKKIMSTCHLLSLSCGPCIHTLAFASFLAFASSASFLAFANASWWRPTGGWEAKGKGQSFCPIFLTEIEDRRRDSKFFRMLRICFKQTSHSARSSWLHLVKPGPQRGKRRIHTT